MMHYSKYLYVIKYLFINTSFLAFIVTFVGFSCSNPQGSTKNVCLQSVVVGEISQESAIMQARLTKSDTLINGYIQGQPGYVRFHLFEAKKRDEVIRSPWLFANEKRDYLVKHKFNKLSPGTEYMYTLEYGKDTVNTKKENKGSFKTIYTRNNENPVSLVMVTGMHYYRFSHGGSGGGDTERKSGATAEDIKYGFPGYSAILEQKPDFWIGNGDNVYYDHPSENAAGTIEDMRKHWHRLYSMTRFQKLLSVTPTYWLKDDHDYRYDDADTTNFNKGKERSKPTHEEGKYVFLEQVPICEEVSHCTTYRTHRINKHLQLWFVEGRDYRSPNHMEDGPEKSIWGKKQKKWLKSTLLASDATFRILISPTPMIGPDDHWKTDNHTNLGGFRYERDQFFSWLLENDLLQKNFYIFCGDRHWQYHSIHPDGIEEFSCGALVDANSRLGRLPGDENSTDPEAKIEQPYTQKEPSGGFLKVTFSLNRENIPEMHVHFFDENGNELYKTIKKSKIH